MALTIKYQTTYSNIANEKMTLSFFEDDSTGEGVTVFQHERLNKNKKYSFNQALNLFTLSIDERASIYYFIMFMRDRAKYLNEAMKIAEQMLKDGTLSDYVKDGIEKQDDLKMTEKLNEALNLLDGVDDSDSLWKTD